MITYTEALILGVIQGLTEFIPISSTAHLRIMPALFGWRDPGAAYSAVIQLGTLVSLLVYFRNDIYTFGKAAIVGIFSGRPFEQRDARMAWFMVLGTVPVSVFGLLFSRFITGPARSLYVIAGSLIGLAILLWLADRFGKREKSIEQSTWRDWLWIGIGQSLALIPGSSRSGTTLTAGLMLGYTREAAMRISFLLGIPAIGLSGVYELIQERAALAQAGFGGLLLGTVAAALVGYAAIAGLLRFLRTHSTLVFALYRVGLGASILVLLWQGLLRPLG